ncbi:MAG TPA: 4Fe-4S dicluster domain-containing protein [Candidatus Omnitrophota bacterium]|nr:4Fe-4S dicluster domain-containing protein [Candidatus Omnitrophota bacterium]
MRLPKVREIGEALRSLFSRPFTSDFPFKPVVTPEGFRGKPQYYQDECVGCLACFEVCPARAIEYTDDKSGKLRTLTHHQDQCIYCQQCERACITGKGIVLTREYDLATYDRKSSITQSKKELVICGHCGATVGCLDHLKFLAKKVGPLLYANPNLVLARHAELDLLVSQSATESPHPRGGHLKLLCPDCRREMILKEQW